MNLTARLSWLDASTTIRLAFAGLSGLVAVLTGTVVDVLPWLLLVVVLDLMVLVLDSIAGARRAVVETFVVGLLGSSAAVAGAAYALTDTVNGTGAALLILIPAYHAGSRYGRFGFLLTSAVGGSAYLLAVAAFESSAQVTVGMFAWLAAASVLGLLGAWNQRLTTQQAASEPDPAAREAIELIQRLEDLSGQMSTGLDAPASATLTLDVLAREVPSSRSAVLVTEDDEHFVPVALRGSTRAPWGIAEQVSEVLRQKRGRWAPDEIRFTDENGPRLALVVPLALGSESACVVIAERSQDRPFTASDRACAEEVTRRMGPTLQAGLLFGTLKQHASIEERNRIARDIHDGIAQDLAALGYQVDALRAQAGPPGSGLRDGLDALRSRLGAAMADLRSNITDLRVRERPETGLGAVLGSAVQSFGSVTGVRTTMTVSEGRRRLDPRVELVVHRVVMNVLADAQASGARNASVTLTTSVAGPAQVEVSHDGHPRRARQSYGDPGLDQLDATLEVEERPSGRTTVSLTVGEPVLPRPLPSPTS